MADLPFDLDAVRQWQDYRAPASSVSDHGKVSVTVPVAVWNQMLSDLAACCDEIEKLQEGTA